MTSNKEQLAEQYAIGTLRHTEHVSDAEIAFLAGYESAEKRIKDLYNKYCSQLKEEQQPKLTKTVNKEKVLILSSKIDVLGELKNKL